MSEAPSLYLREEGRSTGPFDIDEVRARYARGELGGDVMSCAAGESGWQSLDRRWKPVAHGRRVDPGIALPFVAVMATAVSSALPGHLYPSLPQWAMHPGVVWAAMAGCIALAFGCIAVRWRQRIAHRRVPGTPLAIALAVVIAGAAFSVAAGVVGAPNMRWVMAEPNAVVDYDPERHEIRITGSIGLHLPGDLRHAFAAHPEARGVAINSPGGLLDMAYVAASVILENKAPIRVVHMCASACTVLWASIPQRDIDAKAYLGLHQSHPGDTYDALLHEGSAAEMEKRDVRTLAAAGFSQRLLAERAATPPQDVTWVSVRRLRAEGVRFGDGVASK